MKTMLIAITLISLFAPAPLGIAQAQGSGQGRGIDDVEVIKTTATVEKVDLEKRKITLLLEDGKKKTFRVDKSVQNLDRVQIGDHLNLAYTEELIVVVSKSNETPGAASAGAVSVAPRGSKPGTVMVETTAMSGKILAVDAEKHKVQIEEPDSKKKTIKVSKNISLDQLQTGATVDALLTESLVVEVVK